jgi:hypothetical protein
MAYAFWRPCPTPGCFRRVLLGGAAAPPSKTRTTLPRRREVGASEAAQAENAYALAKAWGVGGRELANVVVSDRNEPLVKDEVNMEEIIIWESNGECIRACELAVYQAMKDLGMKAKVIINSEPPLISRNQLWDRLPVLEIGGLYWSLRPGQPFTVAQVTGLLRKTILAKPPENSGGEANAG